MVKYLVNVDFTDKEAYELVKKGTELDITEARAKEIILSLGEGALTKPEEVKEEVKEETLASTPVEEQKETKEGE